MTGVQTCALPISEAASLIHHGQNVGFSGFTPAGAPKAIPLAIAERAIAADACEMVSFTEKALGLSAGRALVGSTGRIGVTMPMDNVRAGIIEAATLLGSTVEHADNAVEAIMTSDRKPKQIAVEFKFSGKTVRIGGICKGAGMIQPGMSPTGARPATLPDRKAHV